MEPKIEKFEHYIGLDWAQRNMAAAVITEGRKGFRVIEGKPDINKLKRFVNSFKGTKRLVIEETTSTHWLFVELVGCVDELAVCDPYKNKLMTHGPKNDRIDACKLAEYGKDRDMNMVYHSTSSIMQLRRLVSGYEDLIKAIVRAKNQLSAVYRGECKNYQNKERLHWAENEFVSSLKDKEIEFLEEQKTDYEKAFRKAVRNTTVRNLMDIPGIGLIGAVKIAAVVISAKRFRDKSKFFGYCGLAKHVLMSGGRCYGKRKTRYNRIMKCVFKTAAMAAISGNNMFKEYYDILLERGMPDHTARNAVARRIAAITLGVMKSGKKFDPGIVQIKEAV